MGLGHQRRTAWQDEVLQRAQLLVPVVDGHFQPIDLPGFQGLVLGHRQFAAEVEQAVLAGRQDRDHLVQPRPALLPLGKPRQQQAELAVEGIHLAYGFDPWVVLAHPAAAG
ncbi:hypothetical protein D9M71_404770 [compost metagenome]